MFIISAVIVILLVGADLASKALICPSVINAGGEMAFIPKLIRFEYTKNTGMAWGLFQNGTLALTVITVIFCAVMIAILVIDSKRMPTLLRLGLLLVLSGALGNLYDRVFLGYVRDFIAFDFMDFPIFNFADSCITVGAVLSGISLILTKKGRSYLNDSFDENGGKRKKTEDEH